jgi:hypothetical protein
MAKSMTIQVSDQLAECISIYAKKRGLSLSDAAKELLRRRLNLPTTSTSPKSQV